jgi:hypothetical protein
MNLSCARIDEASFATMGAGLSQQGYVSRIPWIDEGNRCRTKMLTEHALVGSPAEPGAQAIYIL